MLEHKSVQAVTGANDYVLAAIQHIRLRRVAGIGMQTGVPQRLSGQRIVSDEVARAVAPEQQLARSAQQTHSPAGRRVLPDDVARPVVDGAQEASHTSDATLGGAVALRMRISVCQVKHTVRLGSSHIEEARVRIEARSRPVGGAAGGRRNQDTLDLRVLLRISDGLPPGIDALEPVCRLDKRL